MNLDLLRNTFLIAGNTVREIQRHKILYALMALVFFIIGASVILGPLSLNEQQRLSINFAFTACHLSLIVISVYFASTLISHEVEKKTAITLFAKPISKTQFIIGKFFGLAFVLIIALCFLLIFILAVHFFYDHKISGLLFIAMWGIFLEALCLLAMAFFFSSFSSSFLVLVYSTLIFIIGHSTNGLTFFINKSQDDTLFKNVVSVLVRVFPNYEKFNWRGNALYLEPLLEWELAHASLYSFSWIVFLLVFTGFFFERKQVA